MTNIFTKNCHSTETLLTKLKSICVLGVTGHGKSSLGNVICGENVFEANAALKSVTEKVQGMVTTWRDISTHVPLICIDTPGFGDSEGRDSEHVEDIVSSLKTIGFVHTFIITWNCLENRFNEQLDSTIRLLSQIFSTDFFRNVLVCFTKFAHDKRSIGLRKKGKNLEKPELIDQMQKEFKNRFGCNLDPTTQFCFIDNSVFGETDDLDMLQVAEFETCLEHIFNFTADSKPFLCRDIKVVLNEIEELRQLVRVLEESQRVDLREIAANWQRVLDKRVGQLRGEGRSRYERQISEKDRLVQETRDIKQKGAKMKQEAESMRRST